MATESAEHSVDSGIPEVWPPRDKFDVDDVTMDDDGDEVDDDESSTPQTRASSFKRKGLLKKTTLPPPPRANAGSSSGYPGVSWNKRMGAWLAFYYDNDTRRSRTFHPKYYDMDVEKAKAAAIDFMKGIEKHPRCSLRKTRREGGGAGSVSGAGRPNSAGGPSSASGNGNGAGASDSVRPLSPNLASVDNSLVHLNGQSLQSQLVQKYSTGGGVGMGTATSTPSYRDVKTSRGSGSSRRGHGSILRVKSALLTNGGAGGVGVDDVYASHAHAHAHAQASHAKKNLVFDYDVVKRNFMLVNTKALDNAFSSLPSAANTNRVCANANAHTTTASSTPDSSRRSFCNVEPGLFYDTFDGSHCGGGNSHGNHNNGRGDSRNFGNGGARSWPNSQVFLNDYFNQTPQRYALDQVYLEGTSMGGYPVSNLPTTTTTTTTAAAGGAAATTTTGTAGAAPHCNPYFDQEVSAGNLYLDHTHSFECEKSIYLHGRRYRLDESEAESELHRLMASVAPSGVDSFEGYKYVYATSASSSPFGSQDIYGSTGYNNLASLNSASSIYASPCATGEASQVYGTYPGFSNFVATLPETHVPGGGRGGIVEDGYSN